MIRALAILAVALLLCGSSCQRRPTIPAVAECPAVPVPVRVTRTAYVPVPDRLVRPVVDPQPAEPATVREAWRAAARRGALLGTCNAQLEEIGAIDASAVEPAR